MALFRCSGGSGGGSELLLDTTQNITYGTPYDTGVPTSKAKYVMCGLTYGNTVRAAWFQIESGTSTELWSGYNTGYYSVDLTGPTVKVNQLYNTGTYSVHVTVVG